MATRVMRVFAVQVLRSRPWPPPVPNRARMRRIAWLGAALAGAGMACGGGDGALDPATAPPSRAFAIWRPGPMDSCTQAQHDAYAVVGPDGIVYPAWHPPTGPGSCTFRHEHGRDPRGSELWDDAVGLPFGYANEVLAAADPANVRDEDHVGHKVEWENDLDMEFGGAGGRSSARRATC